MTSLIILVATFAGWSIITERCNCLVWALLMKARWGKLCQVQRVLNRNGRYHWRVMFDCGDVYEWYARGASSRHWLRNIWYKGAAKRVRK